MRGGSEPLRKRRYSAGSVTVDVLVRAGGDLKITDLHDRIRPVTVSVISPGANNQDGDKGKQDEYDDKELN